MSKSNLLCLDSGPCARETARISLCRAFLRCWRLSTDAGAAAVLDNGDWWLKLAALLAFLGGVSWLLRCRRERRSEPPELPRTVAPRFDNSDDSGWELQAGYGLDAPLGDSDSRTLVELIPAGSVSDLPVQPPPTRADAEAAAVLELAEIMVSFGRARGAEQALEDFVGAHPVAALTPWLKLLELYRQNGQRQAFEMLGLRLRRHFNVAAPEWACVRGAFQPPPFVAEEQAAAIEQLLPQLPTLGKLARIRSEIARIWGTPECLSYLNKLLRDNRNGERRGFAAGEVRELLLLIELMESRLPRSV